MSLNDKVAALNATFATTTVESAIYALYNFVDSFNSTTTAVSLLDFYTNVEVNGSLLLAPDCTYNASFAGEATQYLGRPWLALPTGTVVGADDNEGNSSADAASANETTSARTPWEADGRHQSFERQEGANNVRTVQWARQNIGCI